jgi:cytidine deaminase
LSSSDRSRLSVALVDVAAGHEADFKTLAADFEALMLRKGYGRAEIVRDETHPLRYYAVRYWTDAASAARCHGDADVQSVTARLYLIARITHVINGARRPDAAPSTPPDRRVRAEVDRRAGLDRRLGLGEGPPGPERRSSVDRRTAARRLRDRRGPANLVAAARLAREHASAAFSRFKVGAAIEAEDGTIITGCNIENATYGLTICAERVAMFKAISEGHRAFTRIAVVADTPTLTPPCGACRQILWEFGGNLEIILANLTAEEGKHRLKTLLPLPFDARLL